ncbi:dCTP deaminase [Persephonella sp.]
MLISSDLLMELIQKREIEINPFDPDFQIKGNSVDIRSSDRYFSYPEYLEPEITMLDPKNPYLNLLERDYISAEGIVLEPNRFLIIESLEYIKTPENISIFLESKLRISQLGIGVVNTGWIDGGFEGNIILVLKNFNNIPVRIYPEMFIAHIFFSSIK